MSSRVLILLGVLVACVLVISSEVSARELAEVTSTATTETNDVNNAKYGGGGYRCPYGCCGGRGYSRYAGCKCCTYAGQAAETEPEEKPQN